MTHPPRHPVPIAPLPIDDAVVMRDRNHYIVRAHAFEDDAQPRHAAKITATLMTALTTWRRRFLTRRHLRGLDRRGLADIGLDPIERDREIAKPFWKI
jgi:uncharacterized protein YjiS (DUF1127 family)